jgi:tetratricopeptide (TPR) repeat protein
VNLAQFKNLNNVLGWLIFLIAASVYTQTMESTASLWDCGEFISSVYKQQVVHPPGAPMFLMLARPFTFLAGGDPQLIALSVNFMSALCSGFAILFLFWITTHVARRILTDYSTEDLTMSQAIIIFGAGTIAALCGTFSDSIWFSAVEGEVYSMSLMFTSIVFWAILKWEEAAEEPYADRWLLFIAFMMGVSIFVHWLNLLCIPAMTFIYYFRRYKTTWRGIAMAFVASMFILGLIYSIVITKLVGMAASLELILVNGMGLPFHSGVILFVALLAGFFFLSLRYTAQKRKVTWHNALLGLLFIIIGYSSIVATVVRSNAEPNIDMNSPRDIVSLAAYLNREQYGTRPFLTGYDYTAQVVDVTETGTKYARVGKEYKEVGKKIDYVYQGKEMFFPRIYDQSHKENYEKWLGLKKGQKPSYADNIAFFFKYQIGHMYIRYLMWNYAGRQNDEQGLGGIKDGNWISGINFLDSMRLGDQSNLPENWKNDDSRNTFFFLPLLLGLLGLIFHWYNDRKHAVVLTLLFFFCGMAIIIQGNSPPVEPRERDYVFAGSFWAFTVWIGLGVVAIYDMMRKAADKSVAIAAAIPVICLLAPAVMAWSGWDDHDRSGRFAARDFAANYLNSCAPNAIIFTQGDNDTYPLWYAQEVENIRRDVRVVNLSLLGVDWYIEQLRRKVNDAAPVPMTMKPEQVRGTRRDVIYYSGDENSTGAPMDIKDMMAFVGDDRRSLAPGKDDVNFFPTKSLRFAVDVAKVKASAAIEPEVESLITPELQWNLNKNNLYKNDLMVLDIIAANNWERPIYFAISVGPSSYLGLEKYFQLEGLAYRLVPIDANLGGAKGPGNTGRVNADIMYDNLMNRFKFGNVSDPNVHIDSDLRRMIFNFRGNYARLADALIARGEKEKAIAVLDRSLELMPDRAAHYNVYMYNTIEAYYDAGNMEKANALTEKVAQNVTDELRYIKSLPRRYAVAYEQDAEVAEYFVRSFAKKAQQMGQEEFAKKLELMTR